MHCFDPARFVPVTRSQLYSIPFCSEGVQELVPVFYFREAGGMGAELAEASSCDKDNKESGGRQEGTRGVAGVVTEELR